MCQVTTENFDQLLPKICQLIDKSSFLAFDCEFTALEPDRSLQNNLFDNINSRCLTVFFSLYDRSVLDFNRIFKDEFVLSPLSNNHEKFGHH